MTRSEYMNKHAEIRGENSISLISLHREYHAQYVNPSILCFVANQIGERNICGSKDEHFNDIPLKEWDRLHTTIARIISDKAKELGDTISMCLTCCVAKEAARQIEEYHRDMQGGF